MSQCKGARFKANIMLLDEVLVSVSRVLLFAVNEEWLVEGDVAPGADTVLVVRSEEILATD